MIQPVVAGTVPPTAAAPSRRRPRAMVITLLGIVLTVAVGGAWLSGLLGPAVDEATASFEVWDHRNDATLFSRDLEVGQTFVLQHTHSVTRRLVIETFSVQAGPTVALEELWFDEPGPNLPSGSERIGDTTTTFLREDGAFRVLHHGYPIGSVPLIVGSDGVDHVLVFEDGGQVRLLDVADAGAQVELRVVQADRRGR